MSHSSLTLGMTHPPRIGPTAGFEYTRTWSLLLRPDLIHAPSIRRRRAAACRFRKRPGPTCGHSAASLPESPTSTGSGRRWATRTGTSSPTRRAPRCRCGPVRWYRFRPRRFSRSARWRRCPSGWGIVVDGEIPYKAEARAKRDENRVKYLERDPEIKCYLPGVPRATYMPFPFQIFQSESRFFIAYEYAAATRDIYCGTPGRRRSTPGWASRSATGRVIRLWWRPTGSTAKPGSTARAIFTAPGSRWWSDSA